MIILDNYNLKNISSIQSYNTGETFVRNIIIANQSIPIIGEVVFTLTPSSSLFTFYLRLSTETTLVYSNLSSTTELVNAIHGTTTIGSARYYNIDIEFVDATIEGVAYTNALRLTSNGTIDISEIVCLINEGNQSTDQSTVKTDATHMHSIHVAYTRIYWTMFTLDTYQSNIVNVTDATSISAYGKKIKTLADYETLTSSSGIVRVLTNTLTNLKDPKARMVVQVPFGYKGIDLMTELEVRLAYLNVNRTWSFTEGGVYLSWEDHDDGYRYKQFRVTGVRHGQSGNYTSLTLMEKSIESGV